MTSPTGVTTEFTYTQKLKKYGIAGTEKYFAVTAAVDKIGTTEYNAVSYQTPNLRLSQYPSGTVYPYNDISATDVRTSEKTTDNQKESTLYNNSRIPYKIQTWDTSENILKSEQEIVSFDSYYQPTEINEKSYSDAGTYSLVKTVLQWDSLGNCLSREVRSGNQDGLSVNIDEKTVTEYYSDSNIPSVKIQYSYKKEGEYYAQKIVNSILPSLRKISKSETYSCNINGNETTNDKLLYYYDYLYNSFGQLVQSKTTYSKDNQALMSSNSAVRIKDIVYDDNYGVYPVLTKSFGRYKDVDVIFLKTKTATIVHLKLYQAIIFSDKFLAHRRQTMSKRFILMIRQQTSFQKSNTLTATLNSVKNQHLPIMIIILLLLSALTVFILKHSTTALETP